MWRDDVVTTPLTVAPVMTSWDELATVVQTCVACPELAASRTRVVPGVRPPHADILLLGEAPGAQEDESGVPFVGRSGQLLDSLLGESGIARDDVVIVNVLKCRPPKNRKPTRGEVARCRPWLERQIALVAPLVIVTLGGTAAEWVVGPSARIGLLRPQEIFYSGIPVQVTFHPSAALRFGPNGAPVAALREDLARAAALVTQRRGDA